MRVIAPGDKIRPIARGVCKREKHSYEKREGAMGLIAHLVLYMDPRLLQASACALKSSVSFPIS